MTTTTTNKGSKQVNRPVKSSKEKYTSSRDVVRSVLGDGKGSAGDAIIDLINSSVINLHQEVNNRLDSLKVVVDELKKAHIENSKQLTALWSEVEALPELRKEYSNAIDDAREARSVILELMDKVNEAYESSGDEKKAHTDELEDLIREKIDAFGASRASVDNLESAVEKLAEQVDEHSKKLDEHDKKHKSHEENFNRIDHEVFDLSSRMDKIEKGRQGKTSTTKGASSNTKLMATVDRVKNSTYARGFNSWGSANWVFAILLLIVGAPLLVPLLAKLIEANPDLPEGLAILLTIIVSLAVATMMFIVGGWVGSMASKLTKDQTTEGDRSTDQTP